ncbi:hypothetical protein [uncultured Parasutterella sp.]|uniref:hypothetical protein n=1 Tax=uncultured Parasutterella sp. TaxID=1263098 RepID=UPI00259AA400|nr:hypothetical protein [uncultured Parasutterella sp.]
MSKQPVKGRPIDFSDKRSEPFTSYRLKEKCRVLIFSYLKDEKAQQIIANLEYLGSRKLDEIHEHETGMGTSFFSTEVEKMWVKPEILLPLPEVSEVLAGVAVKTGQGFDLPIFAASPNGAGFVAVLLSPDCFELNPEGPETCRIQ